MGREMRQGKGKFYSESPVLHNLPSTCPVNCPTVIISPTVHIPASDVIFHVHCAPRPLCSCSFFCTLCRMGRLGDVLYFGRQIFFPHWTDQDNDAEPSKLQKIVAGMGQFFASRDGTGTLFSIILHIFILVILAYITITRPGSFVGIDILGHIPAFGPDQSAFIAPPGQAETANGESAPGDTAGPADVGHVMENSMEIDTANVDSTGASRQVAESSEVQAVVSSSSFLSPGGFVSGGGFDQRTTAGRQGALQGGGTCQAGEDAVERALTWLAKHQQHDGGWSLHFDDSCRNCSHSGISPSNRRTAATALALLPFLGAGYTHQTNASRPNPYRDHVEQGLLFLVKDPRGGFDGTDNGTDISQDSLRMYSYGLASIALCEAYAMSRNQETDSILGKAAQRSLWIIETAQDPDYGGWNYRPDQRRRSNRREGGDTSIFSWQLMALKSGKLGGLNVSQSTLYAAQDFLNSVALDGGRQYNYLPSGHWDERGMGDSLQSCTAIGLLMRMYLGWKPGHVFLDEGIEQLVRWGPLLNEGEVNLFYIYHATLALHHYGGEHWDTWNREVRRILIQSQAQQGCEAGSWHFPDRYGDYGGRLLNTALAAMILETPYRIMPLYREIRR